jgi:hypothetical protein
MNKVVLGRDEDDTPIELSYEDVEGYSDETECEESSDHEGEGKITLDHSRGSLSEENSNDQLLLAPVYDPQGSPSLHLERIYGDDFQCQLTGLYQPT